MSRMVRRAAELAATFVVILGLVVVAEWLRSSGEGVTAPDWRLILATAIPAALVMLARFRR